MRTIALAAGLWLAALSAGAGERETIAFQAPSGNIHCILHSGPDRVGARCDILEATLSFPRRPAWCDLDWGHAFEITANGIAEPICHGDTVMDRRSQVLPYGAVLGLGGISCRSERTGMTCTNRQGRGFTLARAGQRVF
jgi:hypothetical protein